MREKQPVNMSEEREEARRQVAEAYRAFVVARDALDRAHKANERCRGELLQALRVNFRGTRGMNSGRMVFPVEGGHVIAELLVRNGVDDFLVQEVDD